MTTITRGAQPGYETERAWLKIVKSLEATLAAPATVPEPVAWVNGHDLRLLGRQGRGALVWCDNEGNADTPLYLQPPAQPERKPMTDKEIAGAIVRSPDPMAFGKLPAEGWRPMVRLVEAFHGIKEDKP